jgi:hypothetical protein
MKTMILSSAAMLAALTIVSPIGAVAGETANMTLALALPKAAPVTPDGTKAHRVQSTFNGCGWYAIIACDQSRSAMQRLTGEGLMLIRTNDYPNFRPGWWCVGDGPYTYQNGAKEVVSNWISDFPTAYVKKGCR